MSIKTQNLVQLSIMNLYLEIYSYKSWWKLKKVLLSDVGNFPFRVLTELEEK